MITMSILAATADLFAWYNAVFVAFFGVGLFFTLLQVIGLGGEADADADVDMDADADVDVDMDADLDADVDADMDADMDADADVDADADAAHVHVAGAGVGFTGALAQLLGLGKVPMSVSLMVLCYTVGVTGWISNDLLTGRFESPSTMFPISLLAALVVGFVVLRFFTAFMGRYVPSFSTSAVTDRQLVGLTGATTLPVDERTGQVAVHDKYGTLHTVRCRVREGGKPIAKNTKVVLASYEPDRNMFIVGRA